ncbi:MAG: aminotransferase class I/II-fold pyridoxal phosphate-dependent enzyme [Cryomorphaceae bacterium]|nr:aminotransferase class I/II-fold pyridoxal phosphate-dependent enzyme [Cryomorphaceae bacterium]
MAESLVGSEIIKLSGEIKALQAQGRNIHNFTIGDFDPEIFPIPTELEDAIVHAYQQKHTNYPAANGMAGLRKELARFIQERQGLTYSAESFLVAGGARPLIHAIFQAVVNPGDEVLFPVPSWNNNHYTHLAHAKQVMVETTPETNFMPVLEQLQPHLSTARLVALCSPLNPTGTVFGAAELKAISEAVLAENMRRGPENPLYIMFDQIYWTLCYGDNKHVDPVSLVPEMREYTIFVDGLSKSFAATGVRVGWSFGPDHVIDKMKSILGHIGAWAPKAEQMATEAYLRNDAAVDRYLGWIRSELSARLDRFYNGFKSLKAHGYPVDVVAPQGALYLTVQFPLVGKKTKTGEQLSNTQDVASFLLSEADLALVPFYAFGASRDALWFRLSVGTCASDSIDAVFASIQAALDSLTEA